MYFCTQMKESKKAMILHTNERMKAMIQGWLLEFRKNHVINTSEHTLNINRTALSQNIPKTDQLKHNCLASTVDSV